MGGADGAADGHQSHYPPVSNEEVRDKSPAVRLTGKLVLSKRLFPGCRKRLTLSTFNTNPHRLDAQALTGNVLTGSALT